MLSAGPKSGDHAENDDERDERVAPLSMMVCGSGVRGHRRVGCGFYRVKPYIAVSMRLHA